MDDLRDILREGEDQMNWQTHMAVHKLSPEIHIATERIKKKRAERLQTLIFALAALMFVALAAYVGMDYREHGRLTADAQRIVIIFLCGSGMTALFAPILAYFAEGGNES